MNELAQKGHQQLAAHNPVYGSISRLRIDAIERGLTVLAIAYGVTTLRISGEYVEEQLKGMGRK